MCRLGGLVGEGAVPLVISCHTVQIPACDPAGATDITTFLSPSKFFWPSYSSDEQRQIHRRKSKLNSCSWGIHRHEKSKDGVATLHTSDIFGKRGKVGRGIGFQKGEWAVCRELRKNTQGRTALAQWQKHRAGGSSWQAPACSPLVCRFHSDGLSTGKHPKLSFPTQVSLSA